MMTAQAAKAAIERTIRLNGGAAYVWGAVKSGIDTPGPDTLVFHLKYPSPLDLVASADYSAYIYDTKAAGGGSLATWLNAPHDAGTGPYTVQTWNKGQEFEVIQKAFPAYWGGWSGSHFKRVVFRVVPQDTTAAQLLRTGQVSFVEQMSPALFSSLRGAAGVSLVSAASWQNLLGQLNSKALNLRQRQAISYGINYKGIVAALQGAATLSSGIVPAGLLGHFSSLPNYSYDPAKAAQLLNQIGYGPGKKPLNLSLTYTQGASNEQVVATLMKSSLAKLNVRLNVQSLAWPTQWGKAKSANAAQHQDIFFEYWLAGLRRSLFLVRQPAADREAAVLQPLLLLQPEPRQADQQGGIARRHQPDGRPAAVPLHAGDDPAPGPDRVPLQRQLPVRDVVRLLRIPGQPGIPERRLRL
jgi:peptide/nickel transport system substrate-binding protein